MGANRFYAGLVVQQWKHDDMPTVSKWFILVELWVMKICNLSFAIVILSLALTHVQLHHLLDFST